MPYLDLTGPGNILGPGIGGINIGDGGIIPGIIGGSLGGGGIFICDENNGDCAPTDDDSDLDDDNNSGSDDDDSDPNDNSGSGSDDDDPDPDDNSGSGSDDDDSDPDDNSGSGSDDDDSDPDDNSGSGSDDDDSDPDDNSGSGSDDDDFVPDDNSGSGSDDDAADDSDEINVLTFNENDIHILTSALNQTGIVQNTGPSHFSHSGLGDIVTALTYNVITHESTGIIFDITGRMKIPTASTARNLGTGKFDFAVQGDLVKTISRFMLSASFGYRMLGNPQGIDLHNVLYGATGIAFRFTPDTTIGASFNIGQSPVRRQDSRDFTLYMSYRLNKNFRLNAYGLRGASERSPDWGGGISLRYAF
ncbi:MAG: transporter [Nitrosomonas sp.]|nr:transporter [Nitrosomonas sp.]